MAPGAYDWSRDANAIWMVKAAQERGVTQVVAFANSSPARMTVSGRTSGEANGGSNLRPEMVDDFARYLVDIARHLREDEGIPVTWISPTNEPQWDWSDENGQEGCHYTTDEIVAVTRALLDTLEEEGLDVGISVPESGEWKSSTVYLDALMEDPALAGALDHFAVHSYWSNRGEKERFARYVKTHYPDLEIWMSEWTEMKNGRDLSMDSALVLADTVYEDLTAGGVTSWQYWIAVSRYFFRDGLIYVSPPTQEMEVPRRLWALGNFSRFVRPSYVRIDATDLEDAALRVVAFRSPDESEIVVVVVNHAIEPRTVGLSVQGAQVREVQVFETSEAHELALVHEGKVPREITFAAQSVTTLVLD
ncbi:MAG: glycoside hydrolase family 30 protein [Anaerolineae bacterium]